VAFEYRPTSYRVGLFAMLLAAAFCAFACTVAVVGVLRERHVR